MVTMAKECLRPAGAAMLVVRSRRGRAREGPTNSSGKFGSFQREVDAFFWGFSRRRHPPRFKQTDIDFSFQYASRPTGPTARLSPRNTRGFFLREGDPELFLYACGRKRGPTRRPRGERKRVLFLYSVRIYA